MVYISCIFIIIITFTTYLSNATDNWYIRPGGFSISGICDDGALIILINAGILLPTSMKDDDNDYIRDDASTDGHNGVVQDLCKEDIDYKDDAERVLSAGSAHYVCWFSWCRISDDYMDRELGIISSIPTHVAHRHWSNSTNVTAKCAADADKTLLSMFELVQSSMRWPPTRP